MTSTLDAPPLLAVFVPGKAAPGGSKKAFMNPKTNRIVVTDDAVGNRDWKHRVAVFAQAAWQKPPIPDPLAVEVVFHIARPAGHFGTGKNEERVKPSAPRHPTKKPDATKLWRACEDALTGVIWNDDAQIVSQHVSKVYSDSPGVRVVVRKVEE